MKIKNTILEIQKLYREGYNLRTDKEVFNHLLKQIEKHIVKLTNLKEKGDNEEVFKREVADLHLLALGLLELEHVDEDTIKASANYYLNKVKENSKNAGRKGKTKSRSKK